MNVYTFTSVINQVLPEPHAGLLSGILFGTKAALSKDFIDALTKTGTLHIIALSGMNISIVGSLCAATLGAFLTKRVTSVFTILCIIGFVLFVGPSPSVIRAAIMGTMTLLATVFGRRQWGIYSLMCTAGVMLLVHPGWIGEVSFQLSFLATLGIMLFAGNNTGNVIRDSFRITMAAQVFTIPLILLTFRRISLISPLTNVLIGWIIPPLTAVGLVVCVLGWIWLPLGYILGWVSWVLLEYLILVVQWTATVPFSSVRL